MRYLVLSLEEFYNPLSPFLPLRPVKSTPEGTALHLGHSESILNGDEKIEV